MTDGQQFRSAPSTCICKSQSFVGRYLNGKSSILSFRDYQMDIYLKHPKLCGSVDALLTILSKKWPHYISRGNMFGV